MLRGVRVQSGTGKDGSVWVTWGPSPPPLRFPPGQLPTRRELRDMRDSVPPPDGEIRVWFGPSIDDPQYVSAVKLELAEPLTPTKLQRFPWKRMLAVADSSLRSLERPDDDAASDASWEALHQAFGDEFANPFGSRHERRPGRKGHPDAFYKTVAGAYTDLVSNGVTNPTTRIAELSEQYGYNRSTVAGWVSTARKKGYLPPARRGRPG